MTLYNFFNLPLIFQREDMVRGNVYLTEQGTIVAATKHYNVGQVKFSPTIPQHLNTTTKGKQHTHQKIDLTTKLSLLVHKKEQKTTSKTEWEDDNNFLHRGESVAAYLFYCGTAKAQGSWPHYFLQPHGEKGYFHFGYRLRPQNVMGYGHVDYTLVCYAAYPYQQRYDSKMVTKAAYPH